MQPLPRSAMLAAERDLSMLEQPELRSSQHDCSGEPLLEQQPAPDYHAACCYLQDAADGLLRAHPRDTPTARAAYAVQLHLRPLVRLALLGLLLLCFLERPLWCRAAELQAQHPCSSSYYPTSNLPYLDATPAFAIELACLAMLLADIGLQMFSQGRRFWHKSQPTLAATFLGLAWVELIWALATPYHWIRFASPLRTAILMTHSRDVRRQARLVLRILPSFASVAAVVLVLLVFFAWSGTLIFHIDTEEGKKYFPTMQSAMWSLLVLMTTCNFPDVMMPAFSANRLAVVFFAAFLLLAWLLCMNLVLAVVYKAYTLQAAEAREQQERSIQWSLYHAFAALDLANKGSLASHTFAQAAAEFHRSYPAGRCWTPAAVGLVADALQADGPPKCIQPAAWQKLSWLLHVRVTQERQPFLSQAWPGLARAKGWQWLSQFVTGNTFEVGIAGMLLANAVVLFIEDWPELEREAPHTAPSGWLNTLFNGLDALFLTLYVLEVAVKVLVLGWQAYWRSPHNRFDFVVTTATVAVATYVLLPTSFSDPRAIMYVVMLRMVRLVRMLRVLRLPRMLRLARFFMSIPYFRVFYSTFLDMLPAAAALFKYMFCFMLLFAAIGTHVFGGRITTDPSSPYYARLKDTDYGKLGYYANSMNDMGSAMITLFELLMVNNWYVIAGGFVAVTSAWARIYFILFYVFGVVISLNLVVAFVLDTFLTSYSRDHHAAVDDFTSAAQETPPQPWHVQHALVIAHINNDELVFPVPQPELDGRAQQTWFRARVHGRQPVSEKTSLLASLLAVGQQAGGTESCRQHEPSWPGDMPVDCTGTYGL